MRLPETGLFTMLKIWKQPRFAVFLLSFCLIALYSVGVQGQQSELQDSVIFDIIRSGDGQVFAINYGTLVVDLIDATTGTLIHSATLPENPRRIALDTSGDRFVWSDGTGSIHLYDVSTSSDVVILAGGAILAGPMDWNSSSEFLAIAEGQAAIINRVIDDSLSAPIEGATYVAGDDIGGIVDLAWDPSGQLLATSHLSRNALDSSYDSSGFQIWEIDLGAVQTTPLVRYDDRGGGSLAWNPDSTELALLINNELDIYDLEDDSFIELTFDEETPITVVWSPTGDYLVTGGTVLRIWDTETWEVVATLPAETYVSAIQWSPDGQVIYSNRGEEGLAIDRNPAQILQD